jgi:hypothetical protein
MYIYQGSIPSVIAFTNKVPDEGQGPNFPYEKGIRYYDSIHSNPDIFFNKINKWRDIVKKWPIHCARQKIC